MIIKKSILSLTLLTISFPLFTQHAEPIVINNNMTNGSNEKENDKKTITQKSAKKAAKIGLYSLELLVTAASMKWNLTKEDMGFLQALINTKPYDIWCSTAEPVASDIIETNIDLARKAGQLLPSLIASQSMLDTKVDTMKAFLRDHGFPGVDGKTEANSRKLAFWAVHWGLLAHSVHGLYSEIVKPLIAKK